MKKAFIFDMDGTVVDSLHIWDAILADLVGRDSIQLFRASRATTPGVGLEQTHAILSNMLGITHQEAAFEYASTVMYHFEQQDLAFIEGFQQFISPLRGCGVTCLVIRRRLDLDHYFDHILNAEDAGNIFKPNPAIYTFAIKKLGISPEHCIIYEDSPEGIQAALGAGISCIKIAGKYD
jgi:HAD superfamily hydrolase (TIGR01509 family)